LKKMANVVTHGVADGVGGHYLVVNTSDGAQ